jgi:tetratricopeptide (TPR) repeat protein
MKDRNISGVRKMAKLQAGNEKNRNPDRAEGIKEQVKSTVPAQTEKHSDPSPRTKWKVKERIAADYEILKVLGGGMAEVYVAFDHKSEDILAVKTFSDAYLGDTRAHRRFMGEAKKWLYLGSHKNVVRARKTMTIEGKPVLFLDYISGRDLGNVMRYGVLSIPLALEFGIQLCRGMRHLHEKTGIVFMGIRPVNCIITRDRALKITDCVLARTFLRDIHGDLKKIRFGEQPAAPARSLLRALPYISPERLTGEEGFDQRSDIYAFGVFLYEMLTGTWPVDASDPFDFMHHHFIWKPMSSRELNGEISRELESVISKCLEKKKESRFSTFREIEDSLQEEYRKIRGGRYPEAEKEKELEAWELNNRGYALVEFGRFELAVDCYNRALQMNPGLTSAWSNKGSALARLGFHKEALECYDRALWFDSDNVAALISTGHSLASLGRRQEAIKFYDRALLIDPNEADAWYNKGCVLAELGGIEEARRHFERTIEINPEYKKTCYSEASLLDAVEEAERALDYYDRAIGLNPGYAVAWRNKGLSLARLGRHMEALSCYRRALEINQEDANTWFFKGRSLADLDRHDEALKFYDRAIDKSPRHADAWFYRGLSLERLGLNEEALLSYDRCLVIVPEHILSLLEKGIALFQLGRAKEALQCLDGVLAITPANAKAWFYKGLLIFKYRLKGDAVKCFQKAIEIDAGFAQKVKEVQIK